MHDKMMKMLMSKKKEGKSLSDSDKKSKLEALGGMRDFANQMMGDKLKNLKKVTVASNSKPGLKQGLHKAEELVDQDPNSEPEKSAYAEGGKVGQLPSEFDRDEDHVNSEHERDNQPRAFSGGGDFEPDEEESPEHEAGESKEFEAGENEAQLNEMVEECNDPEEIDSLIQKLEEKKKQLSK